METLVVVMLLGSAAWVIGAPLFARAVFGALIAGAPAPEPVAVPEPAALHIPSERPERRSFFGSQGRKACAVPSAVEQAAAMTAVQVRDAMRAGRWTLAECAAIARRDPRKNVQAGFTSRVKRATVAERAAAGVL